ncbi:DUF6082 family protein [Actinocorallia sp. API 0066]|uniref:DUF6082 family protein n=1 Tax=Actinocorallia sp. API 0066 TaxID=2896846 RepID=UPI001E525197|nr:DUF6082 family protein [Actinocorallia sp. API 0066]MCD0449932.1 DUF6082 family protein [Actinocorallia sp. API 0066]
MVSPLGFGVVGERVGADWKGLSDIGQAYGGVAALLTAVTLPVLAVSLVVQAREVRVAREQALRATHNELTALGMGDPDLLGVMRPLPDDSPRGLREEKRTYYANLWMSYWISRYRVDRLTNGALAGNCRGLFATESGREYWAGARAAWLARHPRGRDRRFINIVERAYLDAVENGPPADASEPAAPRSAVPYRRLAYVGAGIGACAAGALISVLRRRTRNPR